MTTPLLKMKIGSLFEIHYEYPMVVDTHSNQGIYVREEELVNYEGLDYELSKGYWIMLLVEPDGSLNRVFGSDNLGELLIKARQGRQLFIRN